MPASTASKDRAATFLALFQPSLPAAGKDAVQPQSLSKRFMEK